MQLNKGTKPSTCLLGFLPLRMRTRVEKLRLLTNFDRFPGFRPMSLRSWQLRRISFREVYIRFRLHIQNACCLRHPHIRFHPLHPDNPLYSRNAGPPCGECAIMYR